MSSQYYQLSTDYDLADKHLKEGATLPVWLTMETDGSSELFIASQYMGQELWLDGAFVMDIIDFADYCIGKSAKFLLPIPDPTYELKTSLAEVQQQCSKLRAELALQKEHASAFADSAILSLRDIRTLEDLNTQKEQAIEALQHSLTQALNEADELRYESSNNLRNNTELNKALDFANTRIKDLQVLIEEKNQLISDLQSELNGLKCQAAVNRNQTQAYEAIIKGAQESLKDCFDKNEELEAQNTLANETLTAIAKQLGFESFAGDEVMIAIEGLLLNPKWEQLAKEWKQSSENSKILCEEIKQENEILLDNLNRSQSDRLSELTNIMRMIQALSDTPQDKIDGAIYLIKRVLYDAICKLDPSQSWE